MTDAQSFFYPTNEYTKFEYKKYSQYELVKPITDLNTVWLDFGKLTHNDIPVFSFAPLVEIKKDLLASGYSKKDVKSMIIGLSELPEYANSKYNKTRKAKD